MTTKIRIPAANVVQLLNAQGKTPKIARAYSENIVYSHMNGRIYDENVEQAIKELEAPIRKSTLQNA